MKGRNTLTADLLLLASHLVLAIVSGWDGRVFLVSAVTAIVIRYFMLVGLVLGDRLRPGRFADSVLRRFVKDPAEGGAYTGGGAETPLFGHFIFLLLFGVLPLWAMLDYFSDIPLPGSILLFGLAVAVTEFRDIFAGRVIYFRSGAGQCRNASWNFKQLLALALTVTLIPMLLIPVSLFLAISGILADPAAAKQFLLAILSLWLIGSFHFLLFLDRREEQALV